MCAPASVVSEPLRPVKMDKVAAACGSWALQTACAPVASFSAIRKLQIWTASLLGPAVALSRCHLLLMGCCTCPLDPLPLSARHSRAGQVSGDERLHPSHS